MDEDHPCSTLHDGGPKNLPGMDEGGVQNPTGHQNIPDDPVLGVQQQRVELLLAEVTEEGAHTCKDVTGALDAAVSFPWLGGCTAAQLEGRLDPGGRSRPDAGLGHLRGLTNLRMLSLINTQVTDEGLEHLEGLPNLADLHLRDTQVSEEGAKNLQELMPRCEVRH